MNLSTLSLSALLIPGIAAQLGLYFMVPADRVETALLNGQKPSHIYIEKEIFGFHPLPREPACPQTSSAVKSEVKDCKTPYIYHTHMVFSDALTSPFLANITLSDKDTPQLCYVNVTVSEGKFYWYVDWGLGGEGKFGGFQIVCNVNGD